MSKEKDESIEQDKHETKIKRHRHMILTFQILCATITLSSVVHPYPDLYMLAKPDHERQLYTSSIFATMTSDIDKVTKTHIFLKMAYPPIRILIIDMACL